MKTIRRVVAVMASALVLMAPAAHANLLKPFVLGNTPAGNDVNAAVAAVKDALTKNGFKVVGSYSPYKDATVIATSHPELTAVAAKTKNGGFGVAQRVSVTKMKGKLQVAYTNPEYIGTAYGMGKLEKISAALKDALGAVQTFGSKGVHEDDLGPGKYHYAFSMPYFHDVDLLKKHKDYDTAVKTVEGNLARGAGGTKKVYRIDIPGKEISVFGVAIPVGDDAAYKKEMEEARKNFDDNPSATNSVDTDQAIMKIIDFQPLRSTAYLPYELMVQGGKITALAGRYRIAVHFPDTKMFGEHGFTKIMSAPGGIKKALEAVAGDK